MLPYEFFSQKYVNWPFKILHTKSTTQSNVVNTVRKEQFTHNPPNAYIFKIISEKKENERNA